MKTKNIDLGLLMLRLTAGVLMLLHGIAKLGGINKIQSMLASKGIPEFVAYGVWAGEIIAPILLIIGYRTRLAAVIFAMNCLAAMLLVHASDIFSLTKQGGWATELLGLYFFSSIALIFTGAGKYAVSSANQWD